MSPEPHGSGRHAWQTYERVVRLLVPRITVVAGLIAVALAASGCLGDSDAEAESPPATTTERVETQPSAQPRVDIAKFRAAFKEAFGPPDERPWYGLITGMKMADRFLEISTKLDPESNTEAARTICGEAMNFALNSETGEGIEGVQMMASDGTGLGGCA
jgi:hypothetical protein